MQNLAEEPLENKHTRGPSYEWRISQTLEKEIEILTQKLAKYENVLDEKDIISQRLFNLIAPTTEVLGVLDSEDTGSDIIRSCYSLLQNYRDLVIELVQ
jgi:hypothetical protein